MRFPWEEHTNPGSFQFGLRWWRHDILGREKPSTHTTWRREAITHDLYGLPDKLHGDQEQPSFTLLSPTGEHSNHKFQPFDIKPLFHVPQLHQNSVLGAQQDFDTLPGRGRRQEYGLQLLSPQKLILPACRLQLDPMYLLQRVHHLRGHLNIRMVSYQVFQTRFSLGLHPKMWIRGKISERLPIIQQERTKVYYIP